MSAGAKRRQVPSDHVPEFPAPIEHGGDRNHVQLYGRDSYRELVDHRDPKGRHLAYEGTFTEMVR